jgi:4-hydroxybenzoate polyprenyltransferase
MTTPGRLPSATHAAETVPDAPPSNWVDRWAPAAAKPYLRLARFDRPIGAWLLLFPTWWSQALAELSLGRPYPSPWYLLLFLVGAFVMRGAGCTYNDIVDRNYDAQVARTAARPIPSGQVSVGAAAAFLVALCLIGLGVLLQLNWFTIALGASSLLLIAVYPFAKRYTFWPQAVLGLTFKWGALVGWAAVTGSLGLPALVLYAGSVLWTIGYDTIYAHQDKEDDVLVGVKSTALRFGEATPRWLTGFYAGAVVLWAAAGLLAGAGGVFLLALLLIAVQLAWQVRTLDTGDPANCLARFKSNRLVGWLLLGGLAAEMALADPGLPPSRTGPGPAAGAIPPGTGTADAPASRALRSAGGASHASEQGAGRGQSPAVSVRSGFEGPQRTFCCRTSRRFSRCTRRSRMTPPSSVSAAGA